MRKLIAALIIAVIILLTAFAIFVADKNSKSVAGYLSSNTVFKAENGTITILNEEFRLK